MALTSQDVVGLTSNEDVKPVWQAFFGLTQIPRMSKHEGAVLNHIKRIAEAGKLTHRSDAAGNLVVLRAGTGAGKRAAPVIVQSHVDMVCEKNDDAKHDFLADPIRLKRAGQWLKADGTTLGADNGLGAAAAIALMQQPEAADLPPIEFLFTVEEETGLDGAKALDRSALQLTATRLVNMDSEEWGEICIGCAGGGHSFLSLPAPVEEVPQGSAVMQVRVTGLMGGHSGLTIADGRANALKCAAQICNAVADAVPGTRLCALQGGDKHNAIPREATCSLIVPEKQYKDAEKVAKNEAKGLEEAYGAFESGLKVDMSKSAAPQECLAQDAAAKLLALAVLLPHGVDKMSHAMDSLVETSSNLASIRPAAAEYKITVSSRSSVTASLHALRGRIRTLAGLCGASITENDIYPGWNPAPSSKLVTRVQDIYSQQFDLKPKLTAIHAGLECGILNDRLGGNLDMVSFGPTIHGAHSPDEAVEIATVDTFFELTLALMHSLATQ